MHKYQRVTIISLIFCRVQKSKVMNMGYSPGESMAQKARRIYGITDQGLLDDLHDFKIRAEKFLEDHKLFCSEIGWQTYPQAVRSKAAKLSNLQHGVNLGGLLVHGSLVVTRFSLLDSLGIDHATPVQNISDWLTDPELYQAASGVALSAVAPEAVSPVSIDFLTSTIADSSFLMAITVPAIAFMSINLFLSVARISLYFKQFRRLSHDKSVASHEGFQNILAAFAMGSLILILPLPGESFAFNLLGAILGTVFIASSGAVALHKMASAKTTHLKPGQCRSLRDVHRLAKKEGQLLGSIFANKVGNRAKTTVAWLTGLATVGGIVCVWIALGGSPIASSVAPFVSALVPGAALVGARIKKVKKERTRLLDLEARKTAKIARERKEDEPEFDVAASMVVEASDASPRSRPLVAEDARGMTLRSRAHSTSTSNLDFDVGDASTLKSPAVRALGQAVVSVRSARDATQEAFERYVLLSTASQGYAGYVDTVFTDGLAKAAVGAAKKNAAAASVHAGHIVTKADAATDAFKEVQAATANINVPADMTQEQLDGLLTEARDVLKQSQDLAQRTQQSVQETRLIVNRARERVAAMVPPRQRTSSSGGLSPLSGELNAASDADSQRLSGRQAKDPANKHGADS